MSVRKLTPHSCAAWAVIGGVGILAALVMLQGHFGLGKIPPRLYLVIGVYTGLIGVWLLLAALLRRAWESFAYYVETWPARLLGYYVPERKPKGKRKRKRGGP